jgi:hypothetical protein
MMDSTERHRELVARLTAERARLFFLISIWIATILALVASNRLPRL